ERGSGGGCEGARAAGDPDGEEVGVGGAPLPEAVGPFDDRPELGWVGVEVVGHGELGRGKVVGPPCDLGEVGEVAAPGAAGGPAFGQGGGEAGGGRGRGRGGQEGGAAGAREAATAPARPPRPRPGAPSAWSQRAEAEEAQPTAGGVATVSGVA